MSKVALITGASRGIGKSIAVEYAKNGYDIVINYNKSEYGAKELEKYLIDKYGINVLLVKADISSEEDINNLVDMVVDKFKEINVLVNNAAIALDSLVEDKTKDNFIKTLDVNLVGPFLLSRKCSKYMPKGSSIVMISSTNGIDTYYPYSIDYDASKAGVNILTHDFAKEYAPYVKVNTIAPGWINTEMNKELDKEYIEEECQHILLNRFAEPEEIAEEIYHISESSYLNDSIIKVDGGRC